MVPGNHDYSDKFPTGFFYSDENAVNFDKIFAAKLDPKQVFYEQDLLEWMEYNKGSLEKYNLYATGTSGFLITRETGVDVTRFKSGPLGGDQQVGGAIVDGKIDFMIFLWDSMEPQPHDVDVKALLRISEVWNIPGTCNLATADFLISSPLMNEEYERLVIDYESRRKAQ